MQINKNRALDIPRFFPPFHTHGRWIENNQNLRMQIRNKDISASSMVSKFFSTI
jgi:hypothetical protein